MSKFPPVVPANSAAPTQMAPLSAAQTVVSTSGLSTSLAGEPTKIVRDLGLGAEQAGLADTDRGAASVAKGQDLISTSKEVRREITVLPLVEIRGEQVELVRRSNARYEKIKDLGKGGMGEVSLVRDNDIGRVVALKRLYRPPTADQSSLLRFISEVRTVGQLEHPNIVPIHDVGLDENGNYYFVMK